MAPEPSTRPAARPEDDSGALTPAEAVAPLELDRRIHEPGRLGILSALVGAGEEVTFTELGRLLSLSDGNLIMHLRTLEEAGWVASRRAPRPGGGRKRTLYGMTSEGHEAFQRYLGQLEGIIRRVKGE